MCTSITYCYGIVKCYYINFHLCMLPVLVVVDCSYTYTQSCTHDLGIFMKVTPEHNTLNLYQHWYSVNIFLTINHKHTVLKSLLE